MQSMAFFELLDIDFVLLAVAGAVLFARAQSENGKKYPINMTCSSMV